MRNAILLAAAVVAVALATPVTARAQSELAICRDSSDHDRGIAACTRLLGSERTSERDRSRLLLHRCDHYIVNNDFRAALPDCEEASRLSPHDYKVWNDLGFARQSSGDFDGAIADYGTALVINPGYVLALHNRAGNWADKGEFERALADLDTALRLTPRDWELYNDRGLILQEKGDYDQALADFSEAIRLQPRIGKPYANRGTVWRLKGDLDRALQDQNRAIEIQDKAPVYIVTRGDTYRYRGDFQQALADYDRALALVPDYIPAMTGRGLTFEKMGNLLRARSEFDRALRSPSQIRSDVTKSSLDTARAQLAALDSGVPPPSIPAAPAKAASETSIPTPQVTVPAAVAPQAKGGRRVALVIGNSAYAKVPALANPERDASAMAATLRAIGFDAVTLETNDTREKLIDALRNFANEAEKADWAMVYYAGHGMEMGGVNYLVPVDARLATDRDVQFEAISFDQVMASLEGAKKLKLVLLDACRDNPFAPQMRRTAAPDAVAAASTAGAPVGTRSLRRGLGEVKVSGATLVVYAAKQGEVALDGDGGDSPFAVAVVQRMATPGVEINKVFRLVRDDVMEATAGRQEPYTYGSLPGSQDFFFVQR
jgi:tetratricopeptide (TPR) repeat protein